MSRSSDEFGDAFRCVALHGWDDVGVDLAGDVGAAVVEAFADDPNTPLDTARISLWGAGRQPPMRRVSLTMPSRARGGGVSLPSLLIPTTHLYNLAVRGGRRGLGGREVPGQRAARHWAARAGRVVMIHDIIEIGGPPRGGASNTAIARPMAFDPTTQSLLAFDRWIEVGRGDVSATYQSRANGHRTGSCCSVREIPGQRTT